MALFAQVALPRPVHSLYTYSIPADKSVHVGSIVEVQFGKSIENGIVVRLLDEAPAGDFKLKSIREVYPESFYVGPKMIEACLWVSRQFQSPIGELLRSAAPVKADKLLGTRTKAPVPLEFIKPLNLTPRQLLVSDAIQKHMASTKSSVHLLKGVTGSGKTEVYLDIAREVLKQGKSVLVLVPEISLTSQLRNRFEEGLGHEVILWHSAVADGLRQNQWLWTDQGKIPVIVGARSAIFAPLKNIGLCILDEEHDASFQQEERFRYNARELALFRAKNEDFHVLLGSATPSIESWSKVKSGAYEYHELNERFSSAVPPVIEIKKLDLHSIAPKIQSRLMVETVEAIRETLARDEQVLVFLNRRGYSNFLMCRQCGWVKECQNCSVSLTHYKKKNVLHCHQCDSQYPIPKACEDCGANEMQATGAGTESLDEDLKKLIPEARISRLDRDAISSQARLDEVLDDFRSGKANVLVGTQMIVKGHDFPKVTLVVVPEADSLFHWPDFRAQERAIQSLIQVAGRSGRADLPGRVLIQALDVENPAIDVLLGRKKWNDWADEELELRKSLGYPPAQKLIRIRVFAREASIAESSAEKLRVGIETAMGADKLKEIQILGPSASLIEKVDRDYRFDLYVKTPSIQTFYGLLNWFSGAIDQLKIDAIIEVDPQSSS